MKLKSLSKPAITLDSSLRYIKGVGPKKEEEFRRLGMGSVRELLYYFPYRYEDRRNVKKISELVPGENAVVRGKVKRAKLTKIPYFRRKRVRDVYEIILQDSSDSMLCTWFNQGYLADMIKKDQELVLYSKVIEDGLRMRFNSPEYEILKDGMDALSIGRIVSFYPSLGALSQKYMRKIIDASLQSQVSRLEDAIPFSIRKNQGLLNIAQALENIHEPESFEQAKAARERFIFEELFFSQILVYLRKAKHRQQEGLPFSIDDDFVKKVRENISFELTSSQKKVLQEIAADLTKAYPMHRLLQGDVGCGKTVVAAFAIGLAVKNNCQAALMVPTEVLTTQHKDTLESMFRGCNFNIEILTSSLSAKEISDIHKRLEEGKIDIIIGTHSLIQEKIKFKKLGLVVIDEQHKFGVGQRALLPKKGIPNPHCLVMSATPIPRSLALSLYGDLDLSIIDTMPLGRKQPKTQWVSGDKRKDVYDFLRKRLKEGRQAYVVYPIIEESDDEQLRSLEEMYDKLSNEFKDYKVGMFHGRLKTHEKIKVIEAFRKNKINILVCTTVVEVGVSVENATTMVVENPERFGLAQLHQLRGRVRRSTYQPHFVLLSKENLSEVAQKRLKVISRSSDGFKIAEEDLKLRGPGDFFGSMQHGLPPLRIANPLRDLEILKDARDYACRVIEVDPDLSKTQHKCVRKHLEVWF